MSTWLSMGCPVKHLFRCFCEGFLEEINTWIHRLSKQITLPNVGVSRAIRWRLQENTIIDLTWTRRKFFPTWLPLKWTSAFFSGSRLQWSINSSYVSSLPFLVCPLKWTTTCWPSVMKPHPWLSQFSGLET